MQKIEWRLIENFVEADTFQQAYDMLEAEPERYILKEGDYGIFSLEDKIETTLNTEIEYSRKFIKKYTCTCGEAIKKLCKHLIVANILYRRAKNNEEQSRPAPTYSHLPSRVSIPAILSQIPKDDLHRFLLRYARTNKHFGQALKLHFASKVQVASPQQKYHDLIKSMTRLIPLANGKLSKQSIQSLYWVSEELLLQVDDLIAMDTPIEAFAICIELLQSYQAIYRKIDMYLGEYEKFFILIHQKIKTVLDFELAPDLKTDIINRLLELFSDPSYPFINSPHNLFEIIFPHPNHEHKAILIDQTLKKIARKEMNTTPLLAWIKNALKFKNETLLENAFEIQHESSKWMAAIDALSIQNKDYGRQISEWILHRTKDEFWKHKCMDKIWTLFPDESDSIVYALGLLAYSPDEKYIHYLLNKHVSYELIEASLKDSKHAKTNNLLIQFYLETEQHRKAQIIVEGNLTLDFLKTQTSSFYPKYAPWLLQMYQQALVVFLDEYAGPIPTQKIQNLLQYLQFIKAKPLAENLQDWIKKEFKDHLSLIGSL